MAIFFLANPQINFKANVSVHLSQSVLAARHNLNHKLTSQISITISSRSSGKLQKGKTKCCSAAICGCM